jgi:hypothetical protein
MAAKPNEPQHTGVADPDLRNLWNNTLTDFEAPVQQRGAHARPNVAAGAARGGPMFFDLPQRQGL